MKQFMIVILCTAMLVSCGAGRKRQTSSASDSYTYNIVATHPHDPSAYTQGLFWHDGDLIETTGQYGQSTLRRVDPATGRVEKSVALGDDFFGEGSAILDGKIYVLTWMEGKCLVYDTDFQPINQFSYRGEGWGLTTDGERLYMSDGTPNITVRNAETFAIERTIAVRLNGANVHYINELEWIDGKIWANVYMSEQVMIIDPISGVVEGVVDFSGLTSRLTITRQTDVMNGIATADGRVFVTGKNWDKLFEVTIVKQ